MRAIEASLAGLAVIAALVFARPTHATSESLFGFGPRNIALAQSDVAYAPSVAAAWTNPAFLSKPGVRVALGYSHGLASLKLDGLDGGVRDIAGTQIALQIGEKLGEDLTLGGGLALHLPNRSLARIAFHPGTEPTFVRFDPASHRTTFDAALALKWGWFSIGAGASVLASAEGKIDLLLGHNANGAFADGEADVMMPYSALPLLGLAADFGRVGFGFRYRGPQAFDLGFATVAEIDVQGNPLNGVTTVGVYGASGYVPATLDMGAQFSPLSGVRLMTSLEVAMWSKASVSAARLSMDVKLGLTPGMREGEFVRPGYRDTLSPRVGVEYVPGGDSAWVFRAGYAFAPSPVTQPRGFASPADASTHAAGAGMGLDLGNVWGVDLRIDAAFQWLALNRREFDKGRDTLPFARYEASGFVGVGSVAVEGAW